MPRWFRYSSIVGITLGLIAFGALVISSAGNRLYEKYFPALLIVNILIVVILFAIVILGGSGSIAGVVLGAFLLIGLQDVFREFESARMLIFGAAMMVMMIICPQGLLPPRRRFYNARFLVGRFPRGVQRAEPAREEAL